MGRTKVSRESRSNNAGMYVMTYPRYSKIMYMREKLATTVGIHLVLKSKPASEWTKPSAPEIHAVACLNACTNKLFIFHATMNGAQT